MAKEERRTCTTCVHCEHYGVGYSSWTITGDDLECMLDLRETINTEFSDSQEELYFAETCEKYVEGTGVYLGLYIGDEEDHQAATYKNWRDWLQINKNKADPLAISAVVLRRLKGISDDP